MSIGKYQSPHRPGNSDLTALRKRHERREQRQRLKGKAMNRNIVRATIGASMLGIAIAGIALVDASGGPDKGGYQSGCVYWHGGYSCEGSPVASPVPVETATATLAPIETVVVVPVSTAKSEIDTITELPATGAGPGR